MALLHILDEPLDRSDYKGRPTTLCKGCGHNSISNQLVAVAYEMKLNQNYVVKLSGIGCSSKSPAYFLGQSHGFNALHGRMPSVGTGAMVANKDLLAIGVSGDGDTASIGMGQFKHMMRRNVPLVYVVENNGVYGLTKGQFSATADEGQKLKYAGYNPYGPVDICMEALAIGATFVARSFAGDAKQVRALLKAAMSHNGTAILDIISPCVTFNNDDTASKSYGFGKAHEEVLHDLTYVPYYEEISVDYEPGTEEIVELHDGSKLILQKLHEDYDPTNREAAFHMLQEASQDPDNPRLVTGLIYYEPEALTFIDTLNVVDKPLARVSDDKLRPSKEALDKVMAGLM